MSNVSEKEQLRLAVQSFRTWADTIFPAERSGEWEMEYDDWENLHLAAKAVLRCDSGAWDGETKELLLFAIARDNEFEFIVNQLNEHQLVMLAEASIHSDQRDAKWQLAVCLGRFPLATGLERILLALADDADEYVRRRALMVLADVGSPCSESLALNAWESGEEYQRMACLHVLQRLNSPHLPAYLALAEQDGRQYLVGAAQRFREQRD
jgi:HEAT repeat protein